MRGSTKKNLLLFIVCAAVIACAFAYAEYRNSSKKTTVQVESDVIAAEILATTLSTTDTDGDGLKDWEEELWGLNANNKDTDNDGIDDGREVTERAQKNDEHLEKSASAATAVKKATQTEEFSKKFFTNYLELRKSGNLNEASIQDLVSRMAEGVTNTKTSPAYTTKNIVITPSTTNENYKRYANTFGTIRERYKQSYENNPLQVSEDGPNLEDPKLLKRIGEISEMYKKMAAELSKVPVPQPLASTHLSLLNSYLQSSAGLYQISIIATDPILAIKGIAQHQEASVREQALVKDVSTFLKQKGIIFTLGEGGRFFETYIPQ